MGTLKVNGDISTTGVIVVGRSSQMTPPETGIHVHDLRDATIAADSFGDCNINFYFDTIDIDNNSNWKGIIHIKGWSGSYAAWELAGNATNGTAGVGNLYHRTGIGTNWTPWKVLLDSDNYTDYTVTKTGSGASGIWGIDISGNATTADHSSSTSALSTRWNTSNITTAPASSSLVYDTNVKADTAGLFPVISNANAIITLNKHHGNYDSQLGFSSNGRLYYRSFHGSVLDTATGWSTIAFTSDTVAGANYASVAGSVDWDNITNKPSTFSPSSHTHQHIEYWDTRDDNMAPTNCPNGLSVHLKYNGVDGLTDGGTFHPIFIIKSWGDYSGGPFGQISITENNNLWFRASSSSDAWQSWRNVIHSGNIGSQSVNYASSAGTASYSNESGATNYVYGAYTGNGGAQGPNYIGRKKVKFNMMNEFPGAIGATNYMDCLLMNTYHGNDVPRCTALGIERYSGRAYIVEGSDTSDTWAQGYEIFTTRNLRYGQSLPTARQTGEIFLLYND